ncbi:STM4015 family protein [Aliterella atlantica]|uniref:GUN4-like domain-containing protein n=1 Tax=Aliterella atlantica CENA595 TaxID=1618023 RepID=A0A0D8ZXS9_9CYAN|nr:STM4015 family protein [Aliterella atlantica]KJH73239.1 hypothetical protein UH38_00010 [Aliterella atlantica CENA595]
MQNNQSRKEDAVLGGQSPFQGIATGSIEGVKLRLNSPVMEVRVTALNDALNYGDAGLEVVLQALQDRSRQIQRSAYRLLRKRQELQVKLALQKYEPWQRFERLEEYGNATIFSDRQMVDFSPENGITDPVGTAYALRSDYCEAEDMASKFAKLLEDPLASKLEALVFGMWIKDDEDISIPPVNALVTAKDRLTNLKAVFLGDIAWDEYEISWIRQSDISPILTAYPQLEVLQVRGGDGLEFTPPVRHDNLKALIVETGGLSRTTVAQICNLNLPALEHLELWFGSEDYGGDCWVESVNPILFEQKFPNLTYLGLRNSQFSDEIADAVVRSPLLQSISVLDLSMGTLSDAGAEILLNCAAISELDILNLSENFLSEDMVQRFSQIGTVQQLVDFEQFPQQLAPDEKLHIVADRQKDEDEDSYVHNRYCSVAE